MSGGMSSACVHRHAVDRDDPVAGLEAHLAAGRSARTSWTTGSDRLERETEAVAAAPDHEEGGEEDDREQEVRPRPREDDAHLPPGPLAPVRVRAEAVLQLVEALLRQLGRSRADRRLLECTLELRQQLSSAVHVALCEAALEVLERSEQAWSLRERRPEVRVQIGRGRTMHSRDLHVAPERDRSDSVFDPLAPDADERWREADVEPARRHADGAGREEVARLVDEDEEAEPQDRDEDVHVTSAPAARSARRRAAESASTSSSRSPAGAPSTPASVSSTTPASPRNGIRPARNACTATSFAAL